VGGWGRGGGSGRVGGGPGVVCTGLIVPLARHYFEDRSTPCTTVRTAQPCVLMHCCAQGSNPKLALLDPDMCYLSVDASHTKKAGER